MSYRDFTLETVRKQFGLTLESDRDLFPNPPGQVPLAEAFTAYLNYSVPLALAINTEKARSEMIIAPILVELKRCLKDQVSLFSGIEFNVDSDQNLNGFCDFIISLSRQQLYLSAPAFIVVEAKNENIKGGLGQCLAAMLAARLFDEREGQSLEQIYGAVTTGNQWKFLSLKGNIAYIDHKDYYIDRIDQIMSILVGIVRSASPMEMASTVEQSDPASLSAHQQTLHRRSG